jgi:hypothetical protein
MIVNRISMQSIRYEEALDFELLTYTYTYTDVHTGWPLQDLGHHINIVKFVSSQVNGSIVTMQS